MKKKILFVSAIAAITLLTGCGGSSSSSTETANTTPTTSVKVVDGYVIGAQVCDAKGVCAATDTNGTATAAFDMNASLSAMGGYIDVNNNHEIDSADITLPSTFTLKAPAGVTVLSPITDLIANGANPEKLAETLGVSVNDLYIDPMTSNNQNLIKAVQVAYGMKVAGLENSFITQINAYTATSTTETNTSTTNNTTTSSTDTSSVLPFPESAAKTVLPFPTDGDTTTATTTTEANTSATATAESNTTATTATVSVTTPAFFDIALSVANDAAKTELVNYINTVKSSTVTSASTFEETIANDKKELIDTYMSQTSSEATTSNTASTNTTVTTSTNSTTTTDSTSSSTESSTSSDSGSASVLPFPQD